MWNSLEKLLALLPIANKYCILQTPTKVVFGRDLCSLEWEVKVKAFHIVINRCGIVFDGYQSHYIYNPTFKEFLRRLNEGVIYNKRKLYIGSKLDSLTVVNFDTQNVYFKNEKEEISCFSLVN